MCGSIIDKNKMCCTDKDKRCCYTSDHCLDIIETPKIIFGLGYLK